MGRCQCKKHGLNGLKLVCPHIDKAFNDNLKIIINEVMYELLMCGISLCEECIIKHEKIKECDEDEDEFLGMLEACCFGCYREWKDSMS